MNVGSLSGNLLLYKTLLNTALLNENTNSNPSILPSNSFESLLAQVLLQAEAAANNNVTASLPPFNSTGVNAFTPAAFDSNRMNTFAPASFDSNRINTFAPASLNLQSAAWNGGTARYMDVDAASLDQHLKGVLKHAGSNFVEAGKQYNINPSLLAAISMHETGNGTSQAARTKHNIAGMMGKGGLKTYSSIQESIFDMARNLKKNYIDQGRNSIAEIGAKYAPIGAANDPRNLNSHWVKGVQYYLRTLTGTAEI